MILRLDNFLQDPAEREGLLREHLFLVRESGCVVALGRLVMPPRLAVFDLDATLIPCEFVDVVAEHRGLAHFTRELTSRAMSGEMSFRESYMQRIGILRGTPVAEIERLIDGLPLASGAAKTVSALRSAGCVTAIVTGGCARLGRAVQRRLGVDALYATELEERGGVLTGNLAGKLLDEEGKSEALKELCARHDCTLGDAVAVGDGANDLRMLSRAGLAILYTSIPRAGRTIYPLDVISDLLIKNFQTPQSLDFNQ